MTTRAKATNEQPVDMITWLREQLDEEARIAQAALDEADVDNSAELDDQGRLVIGDRAVNVWATAHIVRHDPAHVLADIEAKRQMLDRTTAFDGLQVYSGLEWVALADVVRRLIAAPFADRPGYREEWRP